MDEVNHHGIIDTLSWVSQSIADWTVPQVRHPKPVDIALNYYGHDASKHVGNINYGHSSKRVTNPYVDRNVRTRHKSSSIKNKSTRSRRPPVTAKRKPWKQHKRKKNIPSYNRHNLFNKKIINTHEAIMPSNSFSFPSSRTDLSTAPSKIEADPTIAEFLLGKIHKFGKKVFG